MTATAKVWCRCPDPLPPRTERFGNDWSCSACGHQRRYMERIAVQRGGCVGRCGDCRYEARKTGAKVPPTLCRMVTMRTCMAGEFRSSETYLMCDRCIDAELARHPDADIVDGRDVESRAPHRWKNEGGDDR